LLRRADHGTGVAVAADGQPPSLVLDAGPGLRRVPDLLGAAPFEDSVLLVALTV
jgi:hypothetical protein